MTTTTTNVSEVVTPNIALFANVTINGANGDIIFSDIACDSTSIRYYKIPIENVSDAVKLAIMKHFLFLNIPAITKKWLGDDGKITITIPNSDITLKYTIIDDRIVLDGEPRDVYASITHKVDKLTYVKEPEYRMEDSFFIGNSYGVNDMGDRIKIDILDYFKIYFNTMYRLYVPYFMKNWIGANNTMKIGNDSFTLVGDLIKNSKNDFNYKGHL